MKILKIYVYQIRCRVNNKIYIGSTVSLKARGENHFNQLRRGIHPNRHLQSAFNKHKEGAFVFEILEYSEGRFADRRDARSYVEEREQHYLDTLLFAKHNDDRFYKLGYNNRRVASTNLGIRFDEQTRKNMGREKGYICSPEECLRRSERLKGRVFSKDHRKKISEALKKVRSSQELEAKRKKCVHTREHRDKLSVKYGKPVLQFDLSGNLINQYNSVARAQASLGISGVIQACLGKYTKAGGFVFIYKDEFERMSVEEFEVKLLTAQSTHAGGPNAKKVQQLEKDTGEVLNTFNSASEAARFLGKPGSNNISSACLGKLRVVHGYKWKYV